MRTLLNHTIKSNIDLTKLSNKRVKIEALGDGKFRFTSDTLAMPKQWAHQFIFHFLDRRANIAWVEGVCSAPTGYEFEQSADEITEQVNESVQVGTDGNAIWSHPAIGQFQCFYCNSAHKMFTSRYEGRKTKLQKWREAIAA